MSHQPKAAARRPRRTVRRALAEGVRDMTVAELAVLQGKTVKAIDRRVMKICNRRRIMHAPKPLFGPQAVAFLLTRTTDPYFED